jgi:hypothetical protein
MTVFWNGGKSLVWEKFKKSLDALDTPSREQRQQIIDDRMTGWFPEGENKPAVINALKAHEKAEALFLNNRLHYQAWLI